MKVAICVPSQDHVSAGFAYDWARLCASWSANNKDDQLAIFNHRGTLIADQRETLATLALRADCDRVLFLDSDMRFPKDALNRLEAHGKPFVAANYTTRREPIHAVASRASKGPWQPVNTTPDKRGLEAVSAVGLGFALIHTDVFKRLPKPWFLVGYHADVRQYYGEDVWFSRLLQAHGIEVLIDHDLAKDIRHVGVKEFSFADLDLERP